MSGTVQTRLFGTDGIRGKAGEAPLDRATVVAIGQAVAELLGGEILVARDPRESGPELLEWLREGFGQGDARLRDAGILPTPGVALRVLRSGASGGVMISASHNPFDDNGIKVFASDGKKLDDAGEARIEERVGQLLAGGLPRAGRVAPAGGRNGAGPETGDTSEDRARYLAILLEGFPRGRWLEGFRIAIDCANGATSAVAPRLFESLGASVFPLHAAPDGRNINAGCGALHPGDLVEWVRQHDVDLGVAYDGDGDRSLFVSPAGRLVDGDGVLLVMARALKAEGKLDPPAIVGTSMTNIALERTLASEGVRVHRVNVGDRFIFSMMQRSGLKLGGEPSGHIIFSDYGLSGDGLLTTLKLLAVMVDRQASPDTLLGEWEPAPQLLRSLRVARKAPLETLPEVTGRIREIDQILAGRGRMVVRYSGTEPVLRIMIESDSAARNEALADDLTRVIRLALD